MPESVSLRAIVCVFSFNRILKKSAMQMRSCDKIYKIKKYLSIFTILREDVNGSTCILVIYA